MSRSTDDLERELLWMDVVFVAFFALYATTIFVATQVPTEKVETSAASTELQP